MDIYEILSSPVRFRIVQYLQINGEATTKQISEALKDVPAPTIYRHINILLKENALVVKEERKIRGTSERVLAINEAMWEIDGTENIADSAYRFLMSVYKRFEQYGKQDSVDPMADRLCLRTCMLRLGDERFDRFLSECADLIARYQDPDEDGKLRSISIISSPVREEEQ